MGLFSGTPKGTGSAELKKLHEEFKLLLIDGEIIEVGFAVNRDTFLFTNRRLILVNVQGLSGRKVEYLTIPYKNITKFSIETGGGFDLDAELMLWIGGETIPIEKKFNKDVSIYDLQKVLAHHVLNAS
ncbi:MAG: PH domain-containing protein [Desulfuromonadales bacterium]|nr:PH domain-containing protein [Desulfuromonadales bacterium]